MLTTRFLERALLYPACRISKGSSFFGAGRTKNTSPIFEKNPPSSKNFSSSSVRSSDLHSRPKIENGDLFRPIENEVLQSSEWGSKMQGSSKINDLIRLVKFKTRTHYGWSGAERRTAERQAGRSGNEKAGQSGRERRRFDALRINRSASFSLSIFSCEACSKQI